MKISVSLPSDDVAFLDSYARTRAYASRSAVLQQAVRVLRVDELRESYADAWGDWAATGEAEVWETTVGDER